MISDIDGHKLKISSTRPDYCLLEKERNNLN